MSVKRVVFQHSTGEQESLYRPRTEIYVQENIFVVSFHHFSALVSIETRGSNRFYKNPNNSRILPSSIAPFRWKRTQSCESYCAMGRLFRDERSNALPFGAINYKYTTRSIIQQNLSVFRNAFSWDISFKFSASDRTFSVTRTLIVNVTLSC